MKKIQILLSDSQVASLELLRAKSDAYYEPGKGFASWREFAEAIALGAIIRRIDELGDSQLANEAESVGAA